jgi:hypothetical protein
MEDDKTLIEILSETSPRFDVWVHLESGLELADDEFDRLPKKVRTFLKKFGEKLFSQRTDMTGAPDDEFPDLSERLLQLPWPKFAADIAFAQEAIHRATNALYRYVELQPILTRYSLSKAAAKYLREAGRAFLFSFDAASIAFCGAALEKTLEDALVHQGDINRGGAAAYGIYRGLASNKGNASRADWRGSGAGGTRLGRQAKQDNAPALRGSQT